MDGNKPVLLVEDYNVDQEAVSRAFEELKIMNPLAIANHGEEALDYLREHKSSRPCLILLDLNMPRMNGIEFLDVIKKEDAFRRIPVIVFTTSEEEKDKVASYNLGVSGYVVKPVSPDKFTETFRTIDVYWTINEIANT